MVIVYRLNRVAFLLSIALFSTKFLNLMQSLCTRKLVNPGIFGKLYL